MNEMRARRLTLAPEDFGVLDGGLIPYTGIEVLGVGVTWRFTP
jgi:hypothetical protein